MRIGINQWTLQDASGRMKQIDGIGTYTRQLTQGLASHLTVQPVYLQSVKDTLRHPWPHYDPNAQVPTSMNPILSGFLPFAGYRKLEQQIDVFHSTDYLVPKLRHTPVLATVFDSIFLKTPTFSNHRWRQLKNYLLKKNMRYADQVVTISHVMKQEIERYWGISEQQISVVPLGITDDWLVRQSSTDLKHVLAKHQIDRRFILSVGTLQPRKNYERCVQAYEQLPAELQQNTLLVVVGKPGWLCDQEVAKFQQLIQQNRMRWLSYISLPELQALYQASELVLFPSLAEGFGFPVIEGFASQTPVLSSAIDVIEEVAGDAAYLVDPTDVKAMTLGLQELLSDANLRAEYIAKGQQRVKQFSWEQTMLQTIQLYRQLLK
ncbi:MAG: glycosyltransferase [Legionellales bacterium]|nr:glycosyltransferase [Legionellales bacterium]